MVSNGTIQNASPNRNRLRHAVRKPLPSPSCIHNKTPALLSCELSDVEVEPRGVEGPVVVVSVGGLEVTRGMEASRVPETTSEVGEEREVGP